jgi:hypothetical protein
MIVLPELIIALAAQVIALSERADVLFQALTFQEHKETTSELIGGGNGQSAGRAGDQTRSGIEGE